MRRPASALVKALSIRVVSSRRRWRSASPKWNELEPEQGQTVAARQAQIEQQGLLAALLHH